jgi:hypothetical protein
MHCRYAYLFVALLLTSLGCSPPQGQSLAVRLPPIQPAVSKPVPAPVAPSAKAIAPTTEFDFGTVGMNASGQHTFSIRNEGAVPLTLKLAEVSCKCTEAKLSAATLAVGETAEVAVSWKTEGQPSVFHQWVRLATNDPENREIALHVRGFVRDAIRFEPAELAFGEIMPPDTTKTVETLLLSDDIDSLSLEEVKLSDPRFALDVQPLSPAQLAEHRVASGFAVRVIAPHDLPKGDFSLALGLVAKANAVEPPLRRTIPIDGRVLGRISVLGEITEFGSIEFGPLPYGTGGVKRYKVKVRDQQTAIPVKTLTVTPDFVKVMLVPTLNASVAGLYDLTVEIPADTEPCVHRVSDAGKIHFEFDHPRVTKLDLNVDFSVRPPTELP